MAVIREPAKRRRIPLGGHTGRFVSIIGGWQGTTIVTLNKLKSSMRNNLYYTPGVRPPIAVLSNVRACTPNARDLLREPQGWLERRGTRGDLCLRVGRRAEGSVSINSLRRNRGWFFSHGKNPAALRTAYFPNAGAPRMCCCHISVSSI